jgi:hypothetical protein
VGKGKVQGRKEDGLVVVASFQGGSRMERRKRFWTDGRMYVD